MPWSTLPAPSDRADAVRYWLPALMLAIPLLAQAQQVDPVAELQQRWGMVGILSRDTTNAMGTLVDDYMALKRKLAAADEALNAERAAWAAQVQGYMDEIAKAKEKP